MRTILKRIWAFLRMIFVFQKPAVMHLEYISVLIEKKELLLISWACPRNYTLHIPALKKRFFNKNASYVLRVPTGLSQISIYINSAWRKTRYTLTLATLELGESELNSLTQTLKPMLTPAIQTGTPCILSHRPKRIPSMRVSTPQIAMRSNPATVNRAKFNYIQNRNK